MVLKGDSSLLVNRKPFFVPDWSRDIRVTPCQVVRISRLGKNMEARFAARYYDGIACGLNLQAADYVADGDYVRGFAFDYALPVGTFLPPDHPYWQSPTLSAEPVLPICEAIHKAGEVMTLRQGDYIYIDLAVPSRPLVREEVIAQHFETQELLYCKIK